MRRTARFCNNCIVIGVDSNPEMLLNWPIVENATLVKVCQDIYDVIYCIGALPASKQRSTINELACLFRAGGTLVIGELV